MNPDQTAHKEVVRMLLLSLIWVHKCLNVDSNRPVEEKTCLEGFADNKGVDEPAHPPSLISTFVFTYWKILYKN